VHLVGKKHILVLRTSPSFVWSVTVTDAYAYAVVVRWNED